MLKNLCVKILLRNHQTTIIAGIKISFLMRIKEFDNYNWQLLCDCLLEKGDLDPEEDMLQCSEYKTLLLADPG